MGMLELFTTDPTKGSVSQFIIRKPWPPAHDYKIRGTPKNYAKPYCQGHCAANSIGGNLREE